MGAVWHCEEEHTCGELYPNSSEYLSKLGRIPWRLLLTDRVKWQLRCCMADIGVLEQQGSKVAITLEITGQVVQQLSYPTFIGLVHLRSLMTAYKVRPAVGVRQCRG